MIASSPEKFIGKDPVPDQTGGRVARPKTAGYTPSLLWSMWQQNNRTPPFMLQRIPWMLIDPRLQFGLYLIKGPLASKSKIFVKCDQPEAKAFIVKTICRFWQNSLMRALKAVEWGFAPSEVVHRQAADGTMEFYGLKDLYALDITGIKNENTGNITGIRVGNMPGGKVSTLRSPHFFWHVHGREHSPLYGLSRFYPCWKTFLEKWDTGGYRDIRRLFYYKCAFTSGVIYYPDMDMPGSTPGQIVSAQQFAQQCLEQFRTGANFAFPNSSTNADGRQDWIFEPAQAIPPPPGLDAYGDRLDDELWEGLGIPPEIARAEGTGAYAGRLIPQQAFLSSVQELLNWLLFDVKEQILDPLVSYNFGSVEYELMPYSLLQQEDDEDNGGNAALQEAKNEGGGASPDGTAMAHSFSGEEWGETGRICLHPLTGMWKAA